MITIKSPKGGFLAITPVAGCLNCPYNQVHPWGSEVCTYKDRYQDIYKGAHSSVMSDPSWKPAWCPAIAEAQDELPGTADLDFMLNDAIASLKGEQS